MLCIAVLERERLGVDCSFYCNKTKCWQPGPALSPCLEAGAGQAGLGIGDNAINIIIRPHLISVCRKTRLIFITINVFITWTE